MPENKRACSVIPIRTAHLMLLHLTGHAYKMLRKFQGSGCNGIQEGRDKVMCQYLLRQCAWKRCVSKTGCYRIRKTVTITGVTGSFFFYVSAVSCITKRSLISFATINF
jgi:hypothetical protein